jgi:hypothetical protein
MNVENDASVRLAAIIKDRENKLAEAKRLRESAERLATPDGTIAKIEAELSALAGREKAAMRAWAEAGGSTPRPTPDVARRSLLETDLTAARAADKASREAQTAIEAERTALIQAAGRTEAATIEPRAQILVAEALPVIAEFKDEFAALARKREFLAHAMMTVRRLGRAGRRR